jgi:hypothetical protein
MLAIGHFIPELANILFYFYPALGTLEIQPFFGSTEKMLALWYLKYLCEDILWLLVMFLLCKLAYQYSFRLFRVCCLYFAYHTFDFIMLIYNFRRSAWIYWVVVGVTLIATALIGFPERKKCGKVVSIEN